MTDAAVTITSNGVLDQGRAEALAARIRAAVRNGKTIITLALGADTVLASPSFLAFIVRAAAVLRRDGGRFALAADQAILDQLSALKITDAIAAGQPAGAGNPR
jgi:hypothetical protein